MFLPSIPVLPIHSLELCHVKQKSCSNQNKQLEFTSKCNRDKQICFIFKDLGSFPNKPQCTFSTPNPKHPNSSHSLPPNPFLPFAPSNSLPSIHPAPPVSVLAASAFSPNTNSLFLFTHQPHKSTAKSHHKKVLQKPTTKKFF